MANFRVIEHDPALLKNKLDWIEAWLHQLGARDVNVDAAREIIRKQLVRDPFNGASVVAPPLQNNLATYMLFAPATRDNHTNRLCALYEVEEAASVVWILQYELLGRRISKSLDE